MTTTQERLRELRSKHDALDSRRDEIDERLEEEREAARAEHLDALLSGAAPRASADNGKMLKERDNLDEQLALYAEAIETLEKQERAERAEEQRKQLDELHKQHAAEIVPYIKDALALARRHAKMQDI